MILWQQPPLHVQNYVSNYHQYAIISRRLMILTKCDSMLFLLLIVYFTILSHLWEKMGEF